MPNGISNFGILVHTCVLFQSPITFKACYQTPFILSLPRLRPRLTLVGPHRMQHDLVDRLRRIDRVPLAPIITHGVGEDAAGAVEGGGGDGAANFRVTFEAVLGVLVPEVEGAVGAGGAEGAVDGVEVDGVDGVDVGLVARVGRGLAVAFEGEVGAVLGKER